MSFELTQIPWLKRLLVSRWPLFLARAVTLAGFVLTIVAGLIGSPATTLPSSLSGSRGGRSSS